MPLVEAYIGVGSNIRPEQSIREALSRLLLQVRVTHSSTFYRTEPLHDSEAPDSAHVASQPFYINGVWRIETNLAPRILKLEILRPIEDQMGRDRSLGKYAARTIDLDFAYYGNQVISVPGLQIPDPDIRKRPFLAAPMLELAPDLILPDTGERLTDISCAHALAGMEPLNAFTLELREMIRNSYKQ